MSEDGRAQVLSAVRAALGRAGADQPEPAAVRERLERPQSNTIPARGRLQQPELTELFITQARQAGASVVRVAGMADIPAAVVDFCAEHALPPVVVLPGLSPLRELSWQAAGVDSELRLVRSGDVLALSLAVAGIAETGTLVMLSGLENPVTTNFLPEHHLIVVRTRDLFGASEEVWAMLRERGGPLPRTVNWITGPSRSGDIEMVMLMGAHGPIRLHVVVVDDTITGA